MEREKSFKQQEEMYLGVLRLTLPDIMMMFCLVKYGMT